MKDLKLLNDPTSDANHDIVIENYDLVLVDGLDSVRQSLSTRLQLFFGEWFLDESTGVKYYDFIFVKNPNEVLISSVIKSHILETKDVNKIIEYSQVFDRSARELTIVFKVNTTYGLLESSETIGA